MKDKQRTGLLSKDEKVFDNKIIKESLEKARESLKKAGLLKKNFFD